jgi:hypothetical protein
MMSFANAASPRRAGTPPRTNTAVSFCVDEEEQVVHERERGYSLPAYSGASSWSPSLERPEWRDADVEVAWTQCLGANLDSYITSRQLHYLLTFFGISVYVANREVPPKLMWTYKQACQLIERLKPPSDFRTSVELLFRSADWRETVENGGKAVYHTTDGLSLHINGQKIKALRGFISFKTFVLHMKDNGLTDDEIKLMALPYQTLDGDVSYMRLLKDLFPREGEKLGTYHH